MLKLLGDLKCYLRLQDVVNGSFVFRLHNSFTAAVLIGCSLVITANQYVGSPIQCINDGNKDHVKPITTFCWITSTFTMPYAHDLPIGTHAAHPGIASDIGKGRYYTYYQWVCFVLFFQALFCYLPKYIWEAWEDGLLSSLVNNMRVDLCKKEEDKEKERNVVVGYMQSHVKRHNWYAFRYWFCECLCLLNIIVQLWLMNIFFQGEFLKYGLNVFTLSETDPEDRSDRLSYLFPKVTKCTFEKYGPSGTLQKIDSLCILPLNIVNEKTYIFIWFWFMILLTLLTLLIIYRVFIILFPAIRPILLRGRNRMIPHEVASAICRKINIGDWWLLYMIGRNTDPLVYREFIMELVKKIETHASNQ